MPTPGVLAIGGFEPLSVARPLSWLVVLAFLAAAVLELHDDDRGRARAVGAGAWVLFAAFWLVLVPHFVFDIKSIVEGLGSIAAVPLSLFAGHQLYRGRDSLFVLSRAVGLMGLLYLPFTYLPFLESNPARQWLVETVAQQTVYLLGPIDVDPTLTSIPCGGDIPEPACHYQSTMRFSPEHVSPNPAYTILIACTGLGSIAIFAGGILAVAAPLRRKLRALAVTVPLIYGLNLLRNVFIATMFGGAKMQFAPALIGGLFGFDHVAHPSRVSYYLADRILAQFGSVIALVVLTWFLVRQLPELVVVVEDLLYLVTGREYDVQGALAGDEGTDDGGGLDGVEAPTGDD